MSGKSSSSQSQIQTLAPNIIRSTDLGWKILGSQESIKNSAVLHEYFSQGASELPGFKAKSFQKALMSVPPSLSNP